jgi:hypothetical protein
VILLTSGIGCSTAQGPSSFREGWPEKAVHLLGTSRALRCGTRMTRDAVEEIAERKVEEGVGSRWVRSGGIAEAP